MGAFDGGTFFSGALPGAHCLVTPRIMEHRDELFLYVRKFQAKHNSNCFLVRKKNFQRNKFTAVHHKVEQAGNGPSRRHI